MIKNPVKGKIYWAVFWKEEGKSLGIPPHILVPVQIFAIFDTTDEVVEIIEPFVFNDGSVGSTVRLFKKDSLFETKDEAISFATTLYQLFIGRDIAKMHSYLTDQNKETEKREEK